MNIYRRYEFKAKEYAWNPSGRRLARHFHCASTLADIAAIALASFLIVEWGWYGGYPSRLKISGYAMVFLSIFVFYLGLHFCVRFAAQNASRKLPPDARHDYALRIYHGMIRSSRDEGRLLLLMARMDVILGRRVMAEDALGEIRMEQLSAEQVKMYDLLWAAAKSLPMEGGERQEFKDNGNPWNWFIRYRGITATGDVAFPSNDEVTQWVRYRRGKNRGKNKKALGGAERMSLDGPKSKEVVKPQKTATEIATTQTNKNDKEAQERVQKARIALMQETLVTAEDTPRRHPLAVLIYAAMAAHCVFFLGSWLNLGMGWELRRGYLAVGGLCAAIFLVVLAIWTAWWGRLKADRRNDRMQTGWHKTMNLVADLFVCILVTMFIFFAAYSVLYQTGRHSALFSEEVVARQVSVNTPYGVRRYDIVMTQKDGNEESREYFRAPDFIFMERCADGAPWSAL